VMRTGAFCDHKVKVIRKRSLITDEDGKNSRVHIFITRTKEQLRINYPLGLRESRARKFVRGEMPQRTADIVYVGEDGGELKNSVLFLQSTVKIASCNPVMTRQCSHCGPKNS